MSATPSLASAAEVVAAHLWLTGHVSTKLAEMVGADAPDDVLAGLLAEIRERPAILNDFAGYTRAWLAAHPESWSEAMTTPAEYLGSRQWACGAHLVVHGEKVSTRRARLHAEAMTARAWLSPREREAHDLLRRCTVPAGALAVVGVARQLEDGHDPVAAITRWRCAEALISPAVDDADVERVRSGGEFFGRGPEWFHFHADERPADWTPTPSKRKAG